MTRATRTAGAEQDPPHLHPPSERFVRVVARERRDSEEVTPGAEEGQRRHTAAKDVGVIAAAEQQKRRAQNRAAKQQ